MPLGMKCGLLMVSLGLVEPVPINFAGKVELFWVIRRCLKCLPADNVSDRLRDVIGSRNN